MTDEQINAAIADACGIRKFNRHDGAGWMYKTNEGWQTDCPNYCADLNAMHEAEEVLKGYEQIATYVWHLENTSGDWSTDEHLIGTHATARQRAGAFLRTLGKWEEAG
jgi:hypothetical protein